MDNTGSVNDRLQEVQLDQHGAHNRVSGAGETALLSGSKSNEGFEHNSILNNNYVGHGLDNLSASNLTTSNNIGTAPNNRSNRFAELLSKVETSIAQNRR